MVKSWLFEGQVNHERLKPFRHQFLYKVFYLRFPISKMNELKSVFFSVNSFNLFSIYEKDYLDGSDRSLVAKIKDVFLAEGIIVKGEIELQTFPRILGYGFNPVSFWRIYDENKKLQYVLAEVNNTFGDRHYYLIEDPKYNHMHQSFKQFHVSPFFDIKGEYHFGFTPKKVTINYFDSDNQDYFFKSSITEIKSMNFEGKNLLRIFFKYPFFSFMVIYRIHWQALKLYLKKAEFFTRPNPPINMMTKEKR